MPSINSLVIKALRFIAFPLFLIMLAMVAPASGQESAISPIPVEQKPYLKDHFVPTGMIRAGFIPYKAQLVWGEPLQVTFTVQNLGTNNFEFTFGGDYRGTGRHDRFKITIADGNGKALPDPIKQVMDFGGMLQPVTLKTGQIFSNVVDLAAFRIIGKPGIYTVNCGFALDDRGAGTKTSTPSINTTFALTILERTPERVGKVLDELVAKAQALHGRDLNETLALIARFGKEDAVPRLARLVDAGPVEQRTAALGALSMIPTDASLDLALAGLKNSDPAIRAAAAGSLGMMQKPRAVEALLDSLPQEKSPVAEALVLALGTSKSDRVFPVITNLLDSGDLELRRAAVRALVNFGGSSAVATLNQHINTKQLALRYDIVLALAEKLHQPMPAEWLLPVLIGREQNREWSDSLRLLRLYAGEKAVPTMLSCLDFEAAWSGRNWLILNAVRACPKAPPADYAHDYNRDGTPEEREKNLRTLQALKPLAGPVPAAIARPKAPPVPYLKTDPPIDFTQSFKDLETGGVEIKSGFLGLTQRRNGGNFLYTASNPYRAIYQQAFRFRSLPPNPKRCAELKMTAEQVKQLDDLLHKFAVKLCGTRFSDQKAGNLYRLLVSRPDSCPSDGDWTSLLFAYLEAPAGQLREQAKADLIDSVRVFSQNYHAGTVEFVEAARKLLTPEQLTDIFADGNR